MKVMIAGNTKTLLIFAVLWLPLALQSCAPWAAEIKGDVAQQIREGIEHGTGSFDHSKFDAILKQYDRLALRRFDYVGLKAHQNEFEAYLDQIAKADLRQLTRNELLAFFTNAYNAYTLQTILKTITPEEPMGVSSIRDIPDVFDAKIHVVGGTTLSLNNIEHNILRPIFKDPRIHFAVNCASAGCPPQADTAYTGGRIDEQLDAAARRTLQSPYYVRVEKDRLLVTKLLDWYGYDFVNPGYQGATGTLPEYIARYATEDVRQFITSRGGNPPVEFPPYDWSLNRVP